MARGDAYNQYLMERMDIRQSSVTGLNIKVILASKSPRRKELLELLGVEFRVVACEVDESFPAGLDPVDAVRFIAEKKAYALAGKVGNGEVVVAADTVVTIDGQLLGKPSDATHAKWMLELLSGRKHQVITAVALLETDRDVHVFHEVTDVYFNVLAPEEIEHYIVHYSPYDKAGAYGIQEWIGAVAIEKIVGSYTNVVGLPTASLYTELRKLVRR